MNITKSLAESIAGEMVEPLEQKIKELCDERGKIADEAIRKSIPKEVMDCFNRFRSYFCTASSVTLHYGSYEKRVSKVSPFPYSDTYYPYIGTDAETINRIERINMEINSISDEKSKAYASVVSALLALRTFKRVKENFPEAYKHMGKYESEKGSVIALPIDNIMNTLKKYST